GRIGSDEIAVPAISGAELDDNAVVISGNTRRRVMVAQRGTCGTAHNRPEYGTLRCVVARPSVSQESGDVVGEVIIQFPVDQLSAIDERRVLLQIVRGEIRKIRCGKKRKVRSRDRIERGGRNRAVGERNAADTADSAQRIENRRAGTAEIPTEFRRGGHSAVLHVAPVVDVALIGSEEKHFVGNDRPADGSPELPIVQRWLWRAADYERIAGAEEIVAEKTEQAPMKSVGARPNERVVYG